MKHVSVRAQHIPTLARTAPRRVLSGLQYYKYTLFTKLSIKQERNDLDKLSKVMFLLLCHITCVIKQVVFYFRADEIDELIASLDEPLMNAERSASGTAGALLRSTARNAVRLLKVYTGCAVATCVLWIVFPIVYRIQNGHFEFNFWIGMRYDDIFKFSAVLLYSFYATNLVAIGNTTMDAFIVTIFDLCRVQLRILRINFNTLVERAAASNDDCYDAALKKLLVDCLVHYGKIIQTCSTLQKIFSVPLLVQFGVTGWILCMAAYNIVRLNVLSVEFASIILFITCILIEIFLYCYHGNEVTVEVCTRDIHIDITYMQHSQMSDRVCESVYSMQWLRAPVSFQRTLIVVMERAKRPLRPVAGLIIPLTLDTFVTVQRDIDKLARVMFLLLCHITSIVKQIVFYGKEAKIDEMVGRFDEPLFNHSSESYKVLMRATAASASRFVVVYSGCAVVTCTLWITFPVMYHLRAQVVEFPFWTNVDYNQSHTMFYAVLAYSYYVTTLVGIANTTMDAFIATVLSQCKTQLQILRINFESLPQRAADLVKCQKGKTYEEMLMKQFVNCLDHYKMITGTVEMLQDIFGTAILIQFGIGGWILCMAAYKIVSLSVLSIEFASMTLFISCILTELFLYCYYGNEVSDESDHVCESIYSMQWLGTPVSFQRSLLVVMERAKRPLRPAAGLVVPLSLDTFVKIIKSSYTFYAVLRQTK
ncbi:unnamed protein product [Arctia plantaginis]|uniref:Odorant receptor n=1 Tax=Arctia plantaginis TaxID=874455 RepID=A0A8S1A5E7_ARCPL|nr:unnamed protein product [Arctia plantaginis]